MNPCTACLQIDRLKILICGEKEFLFNSRVLLGKESSSGVGKTSLIYAFRDERFTDNLKETDEVVCRVRYIDNRRTLFQMVELHFGKILPIDARNAQAILLLFDNESTSTLQRMKKHWYSKINLHFSHIPLFVVRSKCDLRTFKNPTIPDKVKNSMHALRYLECSAKEMNSVNTVFLEVHGALKLKREAESKDVEIYPTMTTMQTVGVQAVINARECLTNPAAFRDIKETIDSYLPYSVFGSSPMTSPRSTKIEAESRNVVNEKDVKKSSVFNVNECKVTQIVNDVSRDSNENPPSKITQESIDNDENEAKNDSKLNCLNDAKELKILNAVDKVDMKNEQVISNSLMESDDKKQGMNDSGRIRNESFIKQHGRTEGNEQSDSESVERKI
ncbi:GTP-binding domain protein [Dictyocaulus viviparus]|uniref:GTP-binding domain protein n=1 Tax=Dictyocaulus viviparus TaxID=29172 RepID=A0A0D8XN32_DICVI|nr:GTP-binding domain protein [Dictyocaulus viviparus]